MYFSLASILLSLSSRFNTAQQQLMTVGKSENLEGNRNRRFLKDFFVPSNLDSFLHTKMMKKIESLTLFMPAIIWGYVVKTR